MPPHLTNRSKKQTANNTIRQTILNANSSRRKRQEEFFIYLYAFSLRPLPYKNALNFKAVAVSYFSETHKRSVGVIYSEKPESARIF